jgi:hypothetical protein
MVWGKAGSHTPSAETDLMSVSVSNNKSIQALIYGVSTGVGTTAHRFNGDSGSNYARRRSHNGTSDSNVTSQTSSMADGFTSRENFDVDYICNIESEEKLIIRYTVDRESAGGNTPARIELVCKWSNTSDTISSLDYTNINSGGMTTDSNVSVLGSDMTPAGATSATVQDGAIFEETDTNKHYLLDDGTWTEI